MSSAFAQINTELAAVVKNHNGKLPFPAALKFIVHGNLAKKAGYLLDTSEIRVQGTRFLMRSYLIRNRRSGACDSVAGPIFTLLFFVICDDKGTILPQFSNLVDDDGWPADQNELKLAVLVLQSWVQLNYAEEIKAKVIEDLHAASVPESMIDTVSVQSLGTFQGGVVPHPTNGTKLFTGSVDMMHVQIWVEFGTKTEEYVASMAKYSEKYPEGVFRLCPELNDAKLVFLEEYCPWMAKKASAGPPARPSMKRTMTAAAEF